MSTSIPLYWNEETQKYESVEGADGAIKVTGGDGAGLATEDTAAEIAENTGELADSMTVGAPLASDKALPVKVASVTGIIQVEVAGGQGVTALPEEGAEGIATYPIGLAPAVPVGEEGDANPVTVFGAVTLGAPVDQGKAGEEKWLVTDTDTRAVVESVAASAASIDAKLPLPTVSGEQRAATKLTLTSIVHDPNSLISLGGTAVTHRRCDFDFTGGGTTEYLPARRAIRFAVDGTSGQRSTYRQRMWNPYVAGTTMRLTFFAPFSTAQTNQEKRAGLFDDENGVFLLQTASAVSLGVRSSVSGSVVETLTTIPGFDPTLDHVCQIAYQWPAGRIEFWADGTRLLNMDMSGSSDPWMGAPNLPFTAEVRNVGASAAGSIDVHHFNVALEGAEHLHENEVTIRATATSLPTGGKMMIQARVAQVLDLGTILDIKNRAVYVPKSVSVHTTNGPMVVKVFANGTVGGSPIWTPSADDLGVEYDTAGTFTGADGVFVREGTIDTATGSVEVDLGDADVEAFTATSGAFNGSEVVQVVGYARSGTVTSADVTVSAIRLG